MRYLLPSKASFKKLFLVFAVFFSITVQAGNQTYEYRLQNGLKLIVREDHRAPVVVSSVWYRVGATYEHDGVTGISHMLEHMMFKGTRTHKPGEFIRLINESGGQQNAMTTDDYTVYYQSLPANKLSLSLELEADRMQNLILDQALFEKEHQVVMEERRLRVDDNPMAVTWERFSAAAFVNSPMHHPIIGWMTDIRNLSVNDLKQWYETWYSPNNAALVVIGDVDHAQVFLLVKKYFSSIKASIIPTLKPRVEVPGVGLRKVIVDLDSSVPWLVLGYNVPSLTTVKKQSEAYALALVSAVLDSGSSGRLTNKLVRQEQLAVDAGSQYDLYSLHDGLLTMTGTPTANHTPKELTKAFLNEIHILKTTLVSSEELSRIKAQVIAQQVYKRDSMMDELMDMGGPEMIGLSWRDSDEFAARIKAITPEQIRAAAKKYLNKQSLTIALLKGGAHA